MNGSLLFSALSSHGPELLAASLVLPLAMLCAACWRPVRRPIMSLLALAPVPALAAAMLAADSAPFVLDQALAPMVLVLDPPGALLLGVSAMLWIAAGLHAAITHCDDCNDGRFVICWLLTLVGNIGVFLAADLVSFYLAFALASLPAYGLIVQENARRDEKTGLLYLWVALLGEAFLILGFVLLALGAPARSLLIFDGVGALASSPLCGLTFLMLAAGFGTKIGLFPFHVWMPSTYRAAVIPAAAVLSGAASKAGVIGLIRFLPFDAPLPSLGTPLAALGMFTALYGVLLGATQKNPKAILAYSSVSQLGLTAAVLGMGVASADSDAALGATFYAARHVLAKGGLFLAIAVAAAASPRQRWFVFPIIGALALSLAGLPFTGGALAKLAVKEPLGSGVIGALSKISAIGSTLLGFRFLERLAVTTRGGTAAPVKLIAPWLFVAAAAIALPWVLTLAWRKDAAGMFELMTLWQTLWPVSIGAVLAAMAWRWRDVAPEAPEGDILALVDRLTSSAAARLSAITESVDVLTAHWVVAAMLLVAITITLSGAGLLGF